MAKTFKEVLADAGVSMDFVACGTPPEEVVDREIKREPHASTKKLRDLFYDALSCAEGEFPYWYSREYFANDLEVPVVRRARALKAAFSHLTPVIFPGEKLTVHKARFLRGSFPMPWLSESFYMAREDELFKEALERGSASAGEHSMFGQGGGNVVKSFNKVVSLAGKFGMRQEEIPALLKLAKMWVGKSVDDLGNKRELHVEQARKALNYKAEPNYRTQYEPHPGQPVVLVNCPEFTVRLLQSAGEMTVDYAGIDSFVIYVAYEGKAMLTDSEGNELMLEAGQSVLFPAVNAAVRLLGGSDNGGTKLWWDKKN